MHPPHPAPQIGRLLVWASRGSQTHLQRLVHASRSGTDLQRYRAIIIAVKGITMGKISPVTLNIILFHVLYLLDAISNVSFAGQSLNLIIRCGTLLKTSFYC